MPDTYTPAATWHSTITVPVGDDPRTASSVTNPLKDVADNAKLLKDTLDAGIKKFFEVEAIADLTAVATPANGDVALVSDVIALYRFVASDAGTPDNQWIVEGDGGNWYRDQFDLRLTNGGASGNQIRLDPSVLAVPNRLVSVTTVGSNGGSGTADTSGVVLWSSGEIAVTTGDLVEISGFIEWFSTDGAQNITIKVLEDADVIANVALIRTGLYFPVGFSVPRVATTTSAKQYHMHAVSSSATSAFSHGSARMTTKVVRP